MGHIKITNNLGKDIVVRDMEGQEFLKLDKDKSVRKTIIKFGETEVINLNPHSKFGNMLHIDDKENG